MLISWGVLHVHKGRIRMSRLLKPPSLPTVVAVGKVKPRVRLQGNSIPTLLSGPDCVRLCCLFLLDWGAVRIGPRTTVSTPGQVPFGVSDLQSHSAKGESGFWRYNWLDWLDGDIWPSWVPRLNRNHWLHWSYDWSLWYNDRNLRVTWIYDWSLNWNNWNLRI